MHICLVVCLSEGKDAQATQRAGFGAAMIMAVSGPLYYGNHSLCEVSAKGLIMCEGYCAARNHAEQRGSPSRLSVV